MTACDLLRSNVEFAKRVFLDRLGDPYVYGGQYNSVNVGLGADCSGSAGIYLGAAMYGPRDMRWTRLFSTETFPGPLSGFRRVTKAQCLASPSPLKVAIMHGGGGPNSHMNCQIDGVVMESNGSHGTCTLGSGAYPLDAALWNDWWVYDGRIIEDTSWRQPMTLVRGLDYAGGRPSGAALKAAGIAFVCRYLSDGGRSLPGKLLMPAEADDLRANGISIVSNWETTATRMLGGFAAGTADAAAALNRVLLCGGRRDRPIYFSADWDVTPAQQAQIDDYLRGCAQVIGVENVGIYGGYWPVTRALNNGTAKWAWQTEAWSGGNRDYRINIMQRNGLGYEYVDGVQCDINEAHTADYGQWDQGGIFMALSDAEQKELLDKTRYVYDQLGPGFDAWGEDGDLGRNASGQRRTLRAGIAAAIRKLGA